MNEDKQKREITTITITKATKVLIEACRQHPRETYEDIILRLIGGKNGNGNN